MEAALKALRGFRKQKDLTQRQLGEKLNVAPSTIAMWEKGEREPKCIDLKRLADVLDVSVDSLPQTRRESPLAVGMKRRKKTCKIQPSIL